MIKLLAEVWERLLPANGSCSHGLMTLYILFPLFQDYELVYHVKLHSIIF